MPTVEVEITLTEAIEQQCAEFPGPTQTTKKHQKQIEGWCYKLLDCMDYEGMSNALCEILDRIEKAQSPADSESFKATIIERLAKGKIETMQAEKEVLLSRIRGLREGLNDIKSLRRIVTKEDVPDECSFYLKRDDEESGHE